MLNVHFHILVPDAVFLTDTAGGHTAPPILRYLPPPTHAELQTLLQRISRRIIRYLERQGLIECDYETGYPHLSSDEQSNIDWENALPDFQRRSIKYMRTLIGEADYRPSQGESTERPPRPPSRYRAEVPGFTLHAGATAKAGQRPKLEKFARYTTRPCLANDRLSLEPGGKVSLRLRNPWPDRDHITFDLRLFMSRLVAMLPIPRKHTTRFHGVFAPNANLRHKIVPTPKQTKRRRLTWAEAIKRVFGIDVYLCEHCGGTLRRIAVIRDPAILRKILEHTMQKQAETPPATGPPQA